jgi:hypothetical protein
VEDFTAGVDFAEDFTEVVGSTAEAGFMAGADSEAAAAGFAQERAFAEVRSAVDFVVAIAFAVAGAGADGVGEDEVGVGEVGIGTIGGGASVLAGAGHMDIGPDTSIRTGMGTTPGGLRPTTVFLLMIPTMILTTIRLLTRIGLTDIGAAGTRLRQRQAMLRYPSTGCR